MYIYITDSSTQYPSLVSIDKNNINFHLIIFHGDSGVYLISTYDSLQKIISGKSNEFTVLAKHDNYDFIVSLMTMIAKSVNAMFIETGSIELDIESHN